MEMQMELVMEGWMGEDWASGGESGKAVLSEVGSDGLPRREFHCECSYGFWLGLEWQVLKG